MHLYSPPIPVNSVRQYSVCLMGINDEIRLKLSTIPFMGFDSTGGTVDLDFKDQFKWERNALNIATDIAFWLDEDGKDELHIGMWLHSGKSLILGIADNCVRALQISTMASLIRPDICICAGIDGFIAVIEKRASHFGNR